MKRERAIILIDGSNFYFKLKDLSLHKLDFDYTALMNHLAGNQEIVNQTYFVGEVRTDGTTHAQRLYNKQQRLLATLKKHKIRYQFGYLLKSDGKYHEKGVDVHIAMAILVTAYENLADTIYLLSSDTDLLPAVQKAQEKGKNVVYVGFSHKISIAMARVCKETVTLTRDVLLPFIDQGKVTRKKAA